MKDLLKAYRISTLVCLMTLFSMSPVVAHEGHDHDETKPQKVPDAELYRPTPMPDRVVLSWSGDPTTTQSVTWRTDTSVPTGLAQLAVAGAGPAFTKKAETFTAETSLLETETNKAHYHSIQFANLDPETKYAYRVGDGLNWTEWFHFTTASTEAKPFSFVYFGDAQNDVRSLWSRVIREAFSDAPKASFFLHAGDLINSGNNDGEWGQWHHAGGWLNATIPVVATPGNHEYPRTKLALGIEVRKLSMQWRPQFTFPENGPSGLEETAYYFEYQGALFVSLNSNELQQKQTQWLDDLLTSSKQRWKILTFHHPIYSTARGRDNAELRNIWKPLFDKHKVDLVLQGHDHGYARTKLDVPKNIATGATMKSDKGGTVYVVSVSGPKMYPLDRRDFMARAAEDTQLYQIVHIDGEELRYEARTAVGELYDAFRLQKQPGTINQLIEEVPNTPERLRPVPKPQPAKAASP